jgi:hypothetical protein
MATVTVAVLVARWTDMTLRATGSPGVLPDVPASALAVLTMFGIYEATIILRFARRIWHRRQYRVLWRFPVALPVRVDGVPARCLDLHQRGAAVTLDVHGTEVPPRDTRTDVAVPYRIEIDVPMVDGTVRVAKGRLTAASTRPIGDRSVRVGGQVQWDDTGSREAVIEHCYVVQPYGARRALLARRAPRFALQLDALVDGKRARTVDVSEFGAAFTLRRHSPALAVPIRVSIRLPGGRVVTGRFRPLNRRTTGRTERIGGEMEWTDTDWIGMLAEAG